MSSDVPSSVRTVCDIVRTALGPFGATKLVLTEHGEVSTVASGGPMLESLDVEDPAVTLLTDSIGGFADRHRDGTTTVLTLAGALLEEADRLSTEGVHPTVVERGYRLACGTALDYLEDHARPLSSVGPEPVARTALTGTRDPVTRDAAAGYVKEAVEAVATGADGTGDAGSGPDVTDRVAVATRVGPTSETRVVSGLVLDHNPVVESMPRSVADAGIGVLSSTVDAPTAAGETARSDRSVSLTVESFETRRDVREHEREVFHRRLGAAVEAGCDVLATSAAVNDRVKRALANGGVLAIQRVEDAELRRFAVATGAVICPSVDHLTANTLGRADVDTRRFAGRDVILVEDGAGQPVYTLLCRAPDPRSVASFERSVEAALSSTLRARREESVVPGGGAVELGASRAVRERARSITDREQLAVEAFADALTVVPRTLATTAGMDDWGTMAALLSAHAEGRDATGIDVLASETTDVIDGTSVVDAAGLKRDVVTAATDLAIRIVRIDRRLPASDLGDGGDAGPGPGGDGEAGRPGESTPATGANDD